MCYMESQRKKALKLRQYVTKRQQPKIHFHGYYMALDHDFSLCKDLVLKQTAVAEDFL